MSYEEIRIMAGDQENDDFQLPLANINPCKTCEGFLFVSKKVYICPID